MSNKKFGKAPFKMNWNYFINQCDEPLKSYYTKLKLINVLMEKVEGTNITSNRYGIYLFTNNFLIALHGLIKSIEFKIHLSTALTSRQILEQSVYLKEIYEYEDPRRAKGWDKAAAKFRFYGGYILWEELKEYSKVLENDEFAESFNSEFGPELFEKDLKPSDIPSHMFHQTKNLISSLKLEYVISQLDCYQESIGKPPSFLAALKKFSKSMTSTFNDTTNEFGGMMYRNQSRINHGLFNTLSPTTLIIHGGFEKLKSFTSNQDISIGHVNEISTVLVGTFNHFWPKECKMEGLMS